MEIARAPAHHRVAGRQVLVLHRDDRTTALDGLAADVWTMLSEPADPTDIEAALAEHYGPDPDLPRATREALSMMGELLRAVDGPLRRGDRGAPPPHVDALGTGSIAELQRAGVRRGPDAWVARATMQWSVGIGPELDVAGDEWSGVGVCIRERIVAGLAEGVRRGAARMSEGMSDFVMGRDREAQVQSMRCERALLTVVEVLTSMGVEYRVLKGLATAHLDYASPGLRQIGDVDLLVDARDHAAVIARLQGEGYVHIRGGDPGPFELYKSNYLIGPDSIELDLHHRLFRHGRRATGIWERPEEFEIAGSRVLALPRPWRLVHAAAHAMFSGGGTSRLSMHLDSARVLLTDRTSLGEALEIASALDLRRTVTAGIRRSCAIAGVSELVDRPLAGRWVGVRDRVALWAFDHPDRRVLREQVSILLGLTPRQALRWTRAWLRPAPGYRGGSTVARLTASVRSKSSSP